MTVKFIRYMGKSCNQFTKNKVYEMNGVFVKNDFDDYEFPSIHTKEWKDVTHDFVEGSKTRSHLMLKKRKK